MAKYLLAYKGGAMADTPKEQQKQMEAWMSWFGSLGEAVADAGAAFGTASTLGSNGAVKDGGASRLSGYSIITAETLADAGDKAKGCPVLASGGSVEVYEALPMG